MMTLFNSLINRKNIKKTENPQKKEVLSLFKMKKRGCRKLPSDTNSLWSPLPLDVHLIVRPYVF